MNKKALRGVVDAAFALVVFICIEFVSEWDGSFLKAFAFFAVAAVILGIIRSKLDKAIEKERHDELEQEILLNKAKKSAEMKKMLSPTLPQTAQPKPIPPRISLEPITPSGTAKRQEPNGNLPYGMPEQKKMTTPTTG